MSKKNNIAGIFSIIIIVSVIAITGCSDRLIYFHSTNITNINNTLGADQNLSTTSNVTFADINITGLTASKMVLTDAQKQLTSGTGYPLTVAAGSVIAYNILNSGGAIFSTSGLKVLQNNATTIGWSTTTGAGSVVYGTSPTLTTGASLSGNPFRFTNSVGGRNTSIQGTNSIGGSPIAGWIIITAPNAVVTPPPVATDFTAKAGGFSLTSGLAQGISGGVWATGSSIIVAEAKAINSTGILSTYGSSVSLTAGDANSGTTQVGGNVSLSAGTGDTANGYITFLTQSLTPTLIKHYFGSGANASLFWDGNNLIFNTSEAGTGIAWFSGNVSADGYVDRSWYWDKSLGSSLAFVKDSDEMRDTTTGQYDDKLLPQFEQTTYQVTDYSRPVIETYQKEICSMVLTGRILDDGTEEMVEECHLQDFTRTTYPYTKEETGRLISATIGKHEQNLYDMQAEIKALQNRLGKYDTCIVSSRTFEEYKLCVIH